MADFPRTGSQSFCGGDAGISAKINTVCVNKEEIRFQKYQDHQEIFLILCDVNVTALALLK